MANTFSYTITKQDLACVPLLDEKRVKAGLTPNIADYLRHQGYTHRILARLKRQKGGILLNGEPVMTSHILTEGEVITICLEEKTQIPHPAVPVEMPLDVVYEDQDLFVINKPADLPVHPAIGNHDRTLANAVAWHERHQEGPFVFRCINRLDRDTTGILIAARHAYAGARLSADMKERKIHRTYLAIVKGQITEDGTIDEPIARREGSAIERCVDKEKGQRAVTHYSPLHYNSSLDLTLVSVQLETGRTHQIRVHMQYIGHPLIGDFLYSPDRTYIQRQALHSWKLDFTHPISGENMHFECPLPEDMQFIMN